MMRFLIYIGLWAILFLATDAANAEENTNGIPLIGDRAPAFTANSTQGEINYPDDYWNKWVVLFCHPADFTPVCTSELMRFAQLEDDFNDVNCELIGLSVDGVNSHIQWIREIEDIDFAGMTDVKIEYPIISDVSMDISRQFGMIHKNASDSRTIRGVFIIDPKQKIQAVLLYPMLTGRSIDEILRLVKALQVVEDKDVATPEGWQYGSDLFEIRNPSDSHNYDSKDCPAWFMCLKER